MAWMKKLTTEERRVWRFLLMFLAVLLSGGIALQQMDRFLLTKNSSPPPTLGGEKRMEQAAKNAAAGQARLDKNLAAIAQCNRDMNCLKGGFAVLQGSRFRTIQMVDFCDHDCGSLRLSANRLVTSGKMYAERYDELVFRRFNKQRWEELAVMYAEQYTYRRQSP